MDKGYRLSAATGLHKGDRDYQQDQVALLVHPRSSGCLLAVVADGMGGRTGGRKAADQVLLTAQQLFERYDPQTDDASALLRQIGQEAHLVIKLTAIAAEQEPHSTMAAFLLNPGGECHWLHCGDSRVHHFRGTQLVRRTTDHSYVQTLVAQGQLSEEDAGDHPQSNVLTSCLGTEPEPTFTAQFIPRLQIGDTLLACTDGVWHYFNTEELGSVLNTLTPREASEFLVEKARQRAGGVGDNLSLVIVKVDPPVETKPARRSSLMPLN
ncbi:MAG: protein phosphatase 2C domain-containing protein [Burkholderiaceae bacterium]